MEIMISHIIGYAILIFGILYIIALGIAVMSFDLNQPIFKETIEITFKSKDDKDKKDD
ncbi:hypothetical protein [uncultured Muribaculum sp.]|uniref:hypothetical protein n=1 Tax=uncultured Muribaculum sp. TaxID=1918613 RepID=UPI0026705290|nr:hypothetical protein [uncultured Muribaculum sp.]